MKITVPLVLLVLAVVAFAVAAGIGFGFITSHDVAEDWLGWLSTGGCLLAASFLPWSR